MANCTLGPQVPSSPSPPHQGKSACVVAPGTSFTPNYSWVASPNQNYVLVFQNDGNLVLYQVQTSSPSGPLMQGSTIDGQVLWSPNTYGQNATSCVYQTDDNLVIFAGQKVLWASNAYTEGKPNYFADGLYIQDDGNVVTFERFPAWATGTSQP